MYAEYKNVPVHGVQGVRRVREMYMHGVRDYIISLYGEYKLSMRYDTEST